MSTNNFATIIHNRSDRFPNNRFDTTNQPLHLQELIVFRVAGLLYVNEFWEPAKGTFWQHAVISVTVHPSTHRHSHADRCEADPHRGAPSHETGAHWGAAGAAAGRSSASTSPKHPRM